MYRNYALVFLMFSACVSGAEPLDDAQPTGPEPGQIGTLVPGTRQEIVALSKDHRLTFLGTPDGQFKGIIEEASVTTPGVLEHNSSMSIAALYRSFAQRADVPEFLGRDESPSQTLASDERVASLAQALNSQEFMEIGGCRMCDETAGSTKFPFCVPDRERHLHVVGCGQYVAAKFGAHEKSVAIDVRVGWGHEEYSLRKALDAQAVTTLRLEMPEYGITQIDVVSDWYFDAGGCFGSSTYRTAPLALDNPGADCSIPTDEIFSF